MTAKQQPGTLQISTDLKQTRAPRSSKVKKKPKTELQPPCSAMTHHQEVCNHQPKTARKQSRTMAEPPTTKMNHVPPARHTNPSCTPMKQEYVRAPPHAVNTKKPDMTDRKKGITG